MANWLILQNVPHESPGKITDWLDDNEQDYRINQAWQNRGIGFEEDFQGLIIMGGADECK